MKKNKPYYIKILLGLSLLISSCIDMNRGKFQITNHTLHVLDSIHIWPDKNFKDNYISLKPNETKNYSTIMAGGGDGAYGISYKSNLGTKVSSFGYYSNGAFLEKLTKLYIQADTIIVKYLY